MPLEATQTLARRSVPEADCAIAARRPEPAAGAVEGDGVDLSRVPLPAVDGAERVRVPKDDVVPAGIPAGEPFPVGAEGEWDSFSCPDLLTGRDIRNAHRPSSLRVLASGGGSGPVAANAEGPPPLARRHPALAVSGRCIPDEQFSVEVAATDQPSAIRGEGQRCHNAWVRQRRARLAGRRVPQADR